MTDLELDRSPASVRSSAARRRPLVEGSRRDPLLRRLLAVADACAAGAASLSLAAAGADAAAVVLALAFVPVWIVLAKVHGLYDRDQRTLRHVTADEASVILLWSLSGSAALMIFLSAMPLASVSPTAAVASWGVAALGAIVGRSAVRVAWRRVTPPERTLIIGGGELAEATRRKLQLFDDIHVTLLGERAEITIAELEEPRGSLGEIDRVILASQAIDEAMLAKLIAICRLQGVKLSVVPPVRGMFGTAVQLNHVADLPVVEYNTWDVSRSTLLLKRSLDIVVSVLGLIVLSPVLLAIPVAVRATSAGGAIFTQTRAGLDGRPFRMYKFRTMHDGAETRVLDVVDPELLAAGCFKLRDDPRVTRVGRWLRRWSLDELPQLVNVLRGEMSLVGPRPEQVDLVQHYTPAQRVRLTAKPGMTGPMQIYGRGELRFDERLAVEREYIENLSIGRDMRIIAHTLAAVARGNGAF